VLGGEVLRARYPWVPALGLELTLRLDALAWLFAVLVAGVGLLVVIYAFYYLPADDRLGRFYALLLAFMAAMLGVVTSGNLLLLVVFWELTSVCSFFLVAYWAGEDESAARGRAPRSPSPPGAGWRCSAASCCSAGRPGAWTSTRCWRRATASAPRRSTRPR
jgi:multicomponent K+:H+ antiporter subunit A